MKRLDLALAFAISLAPLACAEEPGPPPTAPTPASPALRQHAPEQPARMATEAILPEAARVARPTFTVHIADVGTGCGVRGRPRLRPSYDAGSNDDLAIGADNRFVAYLKAVKPDLQKNRSH